MCMKICKVSLYYTFRILHASVFRFKQNCSSRNLSKTERNNLSLINKVLNYQENDDEGKIGIYAYTRCHYIFTKDDS